MDAISETRAWIEQFVVGLGLCPFAGRPLAEGRVRFVVSEASSEHELMRDLARELDALAAAPVATCETTLLIHPFTLTAFDAFNQFLDVADLALAERGLAGVIQIASFHPGYRFAGVPADDVANATNRSPFPMLHLLREASIEAALAEYGDGEAIPERNVALLRGLGWEETKRRGGRL